MGDIREFLYKRRIARKELTEEGEGMVVKKASKKKARETDSEQ